MTDRQIYIDKIKDASPYIRKEFDVKSMHLFGSVARNEAMEDSDVDLFVEMPPKALKLVALKNFLQELLGKAVDIVRSHPNIDPFLRQEIKKDGIAIIQ